MNGAIALVLWVTLAGAPFAARPDAGAELVGTMRGNFAALVALEPLLASETAFADPKNASTIAASLEALAKVRHPFAKAKPGLPATVIAALFVEQVDRARADFTDRRTEAARLRAKGLTGLCLGCHARQLSPADFATAEVKVKELGLSPLERAHFLASTRQFDAALGLWTAALAIPAKSDDDAFGQMQALRWAVSVSVRAKDDPAATLKLLDGQLARKGLPLLLSSTLPAWQREARAWGAEKFTAAAQTPSALYARAKALIEGSGASASVFPDEDSLVSLLRATGYLSQALEREPTAAWHGEALYLLGVANSAILDPDLYELDTLYLEACVREFSHSDLARKCVDRYADRVLFGFTGSGGTRLPPEVRTRLEQLRALAK